jgi:hypothetical protein
LKSLAGAASVSVSVSAAVAQPVSTNAETATRADSFLMFIEITSRFHLNGRKDPTADNYRGL